MNQNIQEEFEIYFKGQLTQLDVNTLISSLVNFSTVIQQINQELGPDKNIEVKIKPFAPGSFIIKAALLETLKDSLPFIKTNAAHLEKVIDFLVQLLTLRKFLKDGKPKTVKEEGENKTTVENIAGDKIIVLGDVYQFYQTNQVANDAISKNFEALQEDQNIEGIQIKRREHIIFDASQPEFAVLAKRHEIEAKDTRTITREDAILNIVKLVFQEDNKWSFLYDGNKISAHITDSEFYEQIDQGMRFAKGDTLLVDLQVRQKYDPSVNGYLNETYEIVKVKKHIARPEQQRLLR